MLEIQLWFKLSRSTPVLIKLIADLIKLTRRTACIHCYSFLPKTVKIKKTKQQTKFGTFADFGVKDRLTEAKFHRHRPQSHMTGPVHSHL